MPADPTTSFSNEQHCSIYIVREVNVYRRASTVASELQEMTSAPLFHLSRQCWMMKKLLYSHDQLYKHICRCMHKHNNTIITSDTVLRKIYLSLYLKGLCVRGSWRPNKTATYWPPLLWPSAFLSRSPGLLNRGPRGPALCWVLFSLQHHLPNSLISKTPWISCALSYIIVQRPLNNSP